MMEPNDDTVVEEKPTDDFDAAFAAFATGKDTPAADAGDEPGEEGADDPASGGDSTGSADGDGGDSPADPDAGDGVSDADDGTGSDDEGDEGDKPEDDPDPSVNDKATDELIERLASLVKDAPKNEPTDETKAEKPEEIPELYTAEETEFLKKYDEDWSDVAKGEYLKRKGEYRELVGYIFQQVADQFRPVMETVELLSARTQLTDLRSKVDDYDTIRDKVISWVEEQPAYLQVGMKQVIQAGTVDEVADLVGRYRQATGDTAKVPPKPAKKRDELSDDAKKAAEALAPVTTKRSSIPQQDDPNDFDAAFARFAGKQ